MADYPLVDQMTKEERFEFEKENIIRLRRELNIAINRHLIRTQKDLLLILDRSEISGYFWLKKLFSSLTFEDYLNFTDAKGNRVDIIKPDIVFALQVSKEELLQRNVIRGESNTSRNKEREKNIQYYHQLFEETLEEVEGLFDICYIDGNRSKEEIFQEIKKKLKEL
jgi:dTMP kinase